MFLSLQATGDPAKGGGLLPKPNATDEGSLLQLLLQPPLCRQCAHAAKVYLRDKNLFAISLFLLLFWHSVTFILHSVLIKLRYISETI